MADVIRLFPVELSWISCKFMVEGVRFEGFQGVKYSAKREPVIVKGSRPDGAPTGMTRGTFGGVDGTLTVLNDTAQQIKNTLIGKAALAGDPLSYGSAWFVFSITAFEFGHFLPLNYAFQSCRISGVDGNFQQGDDPLTTDIAFKALDVIENGLSLSSKAIL